MKSPLFSLATVAVGIISLAAPMWLRAEVDPSPREDMHVIYQSYSNLQRYMGIPGEFTKAENNAAVGELLKNLASHFHTLKEGKDAAFSNQGLSQTLTQTGDALTDISRAFDSGKKDYALWRLRHVASYCITCHARSEVTTDFKGDSKWIDSLPPMQRAEYQFATRQFEDAARTYLDIAEDPDDHFNRLRALQHWLVIQIRVHPSPGATLNELNHIGAKIRLAPYEKLEIQDWIEALNRWKAEKQRKFTSPEEIVGEGRRLFALSHMENDESELAGGLVESLRATSLIHQNYEQLRESSQFAEALYLLGAAYSEMPHLFENELPRVYLEQCILTFPGSRYAQRSYRVLENLVLNDFTGSAGTHLPTDEKQRLEELKSKAFGTESLEIVKSTRK